MVDRNVMKWIFSHWPCYRSSGSHICLRMTVLAFGFASGQYSSLEANTTVIGPVTGPVWTHPFNNIIKLACLDIFKVIYINKPYFNAWRNKPRNLIFSVCTLPDTTINYARLTVWRVVLNKSHFYWHGKGLIIPAKVEISRTKSCTTIWAWYLEEFYTVGKIL